MKIKTIENGKSNLHINKKPIRCGHWLGFALFRSQDAAGREETLSLRYYKNRLQFTQEKRPLAFVTSKRTLSLIMMVGGKKTTERKWKMKISTTGIYNQHKRNCKSDALQLSMKELTEIYKDLPIDAQMFKRYETLKRRLFHSYTILPQILIGMIAGLGSGVIVAKVYTNALIACVLTILCVLYLAFSSRIMFKIHTLVLMEYEIQLIEEKIADAKKDWLNLGK